MMRSTSEPRRIKTEQGPEILTTRKEAVVPEMRISRRHLPDPAMTLPKRNAVDPVEATRTSLTTNEVHLEVVTEPVQPLLEFGSNYLATEAASRILRRKARKAAGRKLNLSARWSFLAGMVDLLQ